MIVTKILSRKKKIEPQHMYICVLLIAKTVLEKICLVYDLEYLSIDNFYVNKNIILQCIISVIIKIQSFVMFSLSTQFILYVHCYEFIAICPHSFQPVLLEVDHQRQINVYHCCHSNVYKLLEHILFVEVLQHLLRETVKKKKKLKRMAHKSNFY